MLFDRLTNVMEGQLDGQVSMMNLMFAFKVVSYSNLDLPGSFHLVHNSNGRPIHRKINRVLVNGDWVSCFPSAHAKFLSHSNLNNTPFLLLLGIDVIRNPIPFKFFNYWATLPGFREVVMLSWSVEVQGSALYTLATKLKRAKFAIKERKINHVKATRAIIDSARKYLDDFHSELDARDLGPNDIFTLINKRDLVMKLINEEESALR